jgi:methyl-accepting chemotaxis protein
MKNIKIGTTLITTFLLIAILSGIGGVIGFFVLSSTNANYTDALLHYGFAQGDIGRLNTEFNNSRAIIRDIMFTDSTAEKTTIDEKIDKSIASMDQYLVTVQKTVVTSKEKEFYTSIEENLGKYKELKKRIVALAMQNKNTEAHDLLLNEGTPILQKLNSSMEDLMNEKTTTGTALSLKLAAQTKAADAFIFVIIFITFILSLVIGIKISKDISKPVKEMADVAQKMAQGDLSVELSAGYNNKNEISQLRSAFSETVASLKTYILEIKNALSQIEEGNLDIQIHTDFKGDFVELKNSILDISSSLNGTLTHINQAAQQVSSGSEQVSYGAQALAQGATEQASSIEELSASISDISSQIGENAEHASNANTNANCVSHEIIASNKNMEEMIVAMSQINESSSKIGHIIKTIEDIAFQTNILALNAAVEAARAGSAGKGFAVVADEVRNLASKSAEAAKDTTSLIENSMLQVKNGTKIMDKTAKSLLEVVDTVNAVTQSVEKISQASNHQADVISQISIGIDQISSVVQNNSATAEESAAASEELSGQAQSLKILTSKFRLKNQSSQEDYHTQKTAEINAQEPLSFGEKY